MLSYVFMKLLETRPRRYDAGLALLSLGEIDRIKARIVEENVPPARAVLEIGTGTGRLAIAMARRGAQVTGFDISAAMLDVARHKVRAAALEDQITLEECGVGSMDRHAPESFDLVVATLVFSELSADERRYALGQALRVLPPGGRLVLADEVRPGEMGRRLLHALARIPLAAVTYLLTQTTTHPIEHLEQEVHDAGFLIVKAERRMLDSFLYLMARKSG